MMEPSFEKLLALLADAGVEFILVGGVAVTLHGYARLTEAVDILIARTPENVARLLDNLASYGEGFARELTAADFSDEEGAVRIVEETEQSQLDIFTRMSGLTFEDLLADAAIFELTGRTILYASSSTRSRCGASLLVNRPPENLRRRVSESERHPTISRCTLVPAIEAADS